MNNSAQHGFQVGRQTGAKAGFAAETRVGPRRKTLQIPGSAKYFWLFYADFQHYPVLQKLSRGTSLLAHERAFLTAPKAVSGLSGGACREGEA